MIRCTYYISNRINIFIINADIILYYFPFIKYLWISKISLVSIGLKTFVINIEYSSLEDSFSSVKIRAPLIRRWSWIRRSLTLPGFSLIIAFHLCGIACFGCNH